MNHRSTWILFSLAFLLALLLFFFDAPPAASSLLEERDSDRVFPSLSSKNIEEITLTSGRYQWILKRGIMGWNALYLAGGKKIVEDRADEQRILGWVDTLCRLAHASVPRPIGAGGWQEYGLGSISGVGDDAIRVKGGGLSYSIHLGISYEKGSLRFVYARKDEEDLLLTLDHQIKTRLRQIQSDPDVFRTRRPFHLEDEETPEEIFWQGRKGERVSLFQEKGTWRMEFSGIKDRASPEAVRKLLLLMKQIRIDRFLYGGVTPDRLLSDYTILGYRNRFGSEYMLVSEKAKEYPGKYYGARVLREERDRPLYPYLISEGRSKEMPETPDAMRDPKLVRFDPSRVVSVSRTGKSPWTIEKGKQGWRLSFPKDHPLDPKEVDAYLRRLLDAKCTRFSLASDSPGTWDSLTFTLSGEEEKIQLNFSEGKEVATRLEGESVVRWAAPSLFETHYFDFYDRRADAFIFADVCSMIVRRNDRTYELEKEGKSWKIKRPSLAWAEEGRVEEVLRNGAWIMAERVLAEADEESLRKWECLESFFSLVINTTDERSRGTKTRTLTIGRETQGKIALWVSGFPYIYQVGDSLKRAMEKELHACDWKGYGVDFSKIDEATIAREGKTFSWDKKSDVWRLEKSPLPPEKGKKLTKFLQGVRAEKVIQFQGETSDFQRPLLRITLCKAGEPMIRILFISRSDECFSNREGEEKVFLLETQTIAPLLQETGWSFPEKE